MKKQCGWLKGIQNYGVFLAWIVSLTATLISLYFSEFLHFKPCALCWYQRVFMYPLTILLGIATYYEDRKVFVYSFPLAIIGGSIALLQYLQMQFPVLQKISLCHQDVSCFVSYLHLFGFIPIPLLSSISFFLIALFLWISRPKKRAF